MEENHKKRFNNMRTRATLSGRIVIIICRFICFAEVIKRAKFYSYNFGAVSKLRGFKLSMSPYGTQAVLDTMLGTILIASRWKAKRINHSRRPIGNSNLSRCIRIYPNITESNRHAYYWLRLWLHAVCIYTGTLSSLNCILTPPYMMSSSSSSKMKSGYPILSTMALACEKWTRDPDLRRCEINHWGSE